MQYPAHIRTDREGETLAVQSVEEHCDAVSELAELLLEPVGLGKAGKLLGQVHDLGKYTPEFRDYLEKAASGDNVQRGSVNHTFAAVRLLLERFHGDVCESAEDLACEILAAAAGAHHGMFDCIGEHGENGFFHRLHVNLPTYQTAREEFLRRCMSEPQLAASFAQAAQEISFCIENIADSATTDDEVQFHLSLLCRLLCSALIDADRRDTAMFMNGTVLPLPPDDPWTVALERVERRIASMNGDGPINAARREISNLCRAAADWPDGIHRLSVPTGGGKTLTVLRYALAKAHQTGKRRIFFVIPLLSVLEQNAKVIHDFLGDDSLILEHHSNLLREKTGGDGLDSTELLMETWDAPVVITTLVQLLNTLFAGKTSCIRRMQALAGSVIVIDEVQSVPEKLRSLFNLAMNFLAAVCGAEIVLCSATQPCLEKMEHAVLYATPSELVPWSEELWAPFRRTQLIDRRQPGGCTLEQLAAFAAEVLEGTDSLLIICNLKSQAKTLYNLLKGGGADAFHLSTSMCMAHRRQVLRLVNEALTRTRTGQGNKVVCVATQLVEAGVDFSFGSVIRILAGMDNAVQAAGRCNRNGEWDMRCPVYLVQVREEKLGALKEIERAQNASKNLLETFARDSECFQGDLASEESIRFYYGHLFGQMKNRGTQDFPLPKLSTSIYELLSDNGQFAGQGGTEDGFELKQAFKTAGAQFEVFDEATTDILVPYEGGADCIADLRSERAKYDAAFCAAVLKRAKPYSVSLFEHQLMRMRTNHALSDALNGAVLVLSDGYYNNETGVDPDGGAGSFMEV